MTSAQAGTQDSTQAIEDEAHDFLSGRVARRRPRDRRWGSGSDAVLRLATAHGEDEQREISAAQKWQRDLFDAGLGWVDGPVEYGGRGLDTRHARAVRRVVAQYETPNTGCFMVNFQIVGPSIARHGSDEQKRRWLPRIYSGETLCCQMFSEPDAGSDLASLRTSAEPRGGDWIVRGQKVWSSGAHYSQLGELLARTGSAVERHRGITAFLVEMDRPGVEVRPLRQITGSEHFNEVFLDDVVLPDGNRLGDVGAGWSVAHTGLGGERAVMSEQDNGVFDDPVRKLFGLARHLGVADDPAVADMLGEAWAREQVLHVSGRRLSAEAVGGSIAKLQMTDDTEFMLSLASRLLGHRLAVDTGDWGTWAWHDVLLAAPSHRIAGGTDEIQRNIIAERLLGLPREPRPGPTS